MAGLGNGAVRKIAQNNYDHGFGEMWLPADALEDAAARTRTCWGTVGDKSGARPPSGWHPLGGPHVRGCCVVDWVLGRATETRTVPASA